MNFKLKSLLLIFIIFSYLALYQNCGGGMQAITPFPNASTSGKFVVDNIRLKIGDLAVEKSRITQQTQSQQQTTTTTNLISNTDGNNPYQDISYYQINPWPKGELIFKFDASVNNIEKDLFKNACAIWEQESQGVLKCLPAAVNASISSSYLLISFSTDKSSVCYTDLGVASSLNKMVLTENCANSSKVLHLLGHAFGLIDQQLRPDRNEYVKIPTSGSDTANFLQFKGLNITLGTYDFNSIMNHPFVGAYQPITDKVPQGINISTIGNLTKISEGDKLLVNKIYAALVTNGTNTNDGTCASEQLVTWGFGCYYHIPSFSPGKSSGFVLPAFNNQNSAYETSNKSAAQAKCVNGSWQLQTALCSNLPGVTTGTSNQSCAQTTLSWTGSGAGSLCYLADSQKLPQSSSIGSIFEVATQQYSFPVGFGIFVCEKSSTDETVKWTFKSSLTYKNGGEKYSQTKNSFCFTKQDTSDQCPAGMGFSWTSTSGNACSGVLSNPLTVGSNIAVMSKGLDGWARVTCIRELTSSGFNYKIFSNTTDTNDMGYCGYSNNSPAKIDLSNGKIVKNVKCLPIQKLMTWRDNFNGEECSASINITNPYFEGQPYIYQNSLEANSFNSMVTLKCVNESTTGVGSWIVASQNEITAAGGFLPAPICKKACLPPTQVSWTNTANDYTCWGTPSGARKLIENEKVTLKASNLDATSDSQGEFACSANGILNLTQNSTNKCAH